MNAQKLRLKLEVRPTARSRSPRELLIFGLDDTLVDTSLYWLARAALAQAAAAKAGKAETNIVSIFDTSDTENGRVYEVSPGLGPVTVQETWDVFQKICDIPAQSIDADSCLPMARSLRSKFPILIPGAEDLLKWAKPLFTLALLTSGKSDIQLQKLDAAKCGGYFSSVKVVPSKRTEDYLALISEMGFSPRNSWVLGDSIPFEINPALAAGANCIHFTPPHPKRAAAGEGIEEPAEPIYRIHELPDARSILARTSPSLASC